MVSSDRSGFNSTQWIINIWTQRVSSLMSIIGSSLIVMMLVFQRRRARLSQMQNRLILGMSIMDIFNSVALFIGTAAVPRELRDYIYGAMGNQITCSMQASFVTLGLAVPAYNANLCVYYLGVIKYSMTDDDIEQHERKMHIISISIPIIMVILALSFDLFHPTASRGCWLGDRCEFADPDSECEPSSSSFKIMMIYVMLMYVIIIFLVIIFSMGSIYFFVRKRTLAMNKYQSFGKRNSLTGHEEDRKGLQEETLTQAVLYISAYFCTFMPVAINALPGIGDYFVAQLIKRLLFPLQGFWNFVTFIRPRFVLLQEKHGHESFIWILKAVLFGMNPEDEKRSLASGKALKKQNEEKFFEKKTNARLEMLKKSRPIINPNHSSPPNVQNKDNKIEGTKIGNEDVDKQQQPSSSLLLSTDSDVEKQSQPRSKLLASNDVNIEKECQSRPPLKLDLMSEEQDKEMMDLSPQWYDESRHTAQVELQPITTFTSLVAQDVLNFNSSSAASPISSSSRRQSMVSPRVTSIDSAQKYNRRPSLPSRLSLDVLPIFNFDNADDKIGSVEPKLFTEYETHG